MSVEFGSGQFVSIIDLKGVTFSRHPPVNLVKQSIHLLKQHYPYRSGSIYMINAGTAITFFWGIVRPLMPKKVLKKTFFLGRKETQKVLVAQLGLENIESSYSGLVPDGIQDTEDYFEGGYWTPR